jgi:predicted dehydrogenase
MTAFTRRRFLENSGRLLAGTGIALTPLTAAAATPKKVAASDKINVALIGCKGMGWANLTSMLKLPDTVCTTLCDIDQTVLNERAAELQKKTGQKIRQHADFRRVLDDKSIDAVIIGTPDHWHALQMIYACEAGKDVYVEKPISKTIEESLTMLAAARRHNRIVQVGQWQRSGEHWHEAIKYLQSGQLGNIRLTRAWAYMAYGKEFPKLPDEPVPAGVDYDMWLGPAPKRPFNKNRFHGSFRYFWDYAGGLMTDWGVHMIDMVLMGMKATTPRSVMSTGGKIGFPDHDGETPDTQQAVYTFDDFTMIWEHAKGIARGPYNREHGVAFIGNKGTLVIDRNKWEVLPEAEQGKYLIDAMPVQNSQQNGLDAHTKNFAECIKSRQKPNGDIEVGSWAAINAHLGNIAYQLERKIHWNRETNSIDTDEQARALIRTEYRNPWKLPRV